MQRQTRLLAEEPMVCRLTAGGNRIRTIGPALVKGLSAVADERCRTDKMGGVIKHRSSRETTMVGRGASLDGRLFLGGTDGSNPVPSSSESANHRFRDDFTGYARDQDAPTVTRYLTSPRPKRADRDTHSLPRERVRSPAHLALAARSGEGPLPIRFADLGHRALKTGGLLNSRPIFRADRTGSWLRMRHLAAHFSGWFVLA